MISYPDNKLLTNTRTKVLAPISFARGLIKYTKKESPIFIRLYFIFMLLSLGLWTLMVWGQIGSPTKSSQWVAEVYKHKEQYANTVKTPKIVVVAGSNGLFGVDSGILKRAFGREVVNMCVNAGVDLPPILEHAKRVIKRGDIVLMPLEYPLYSYDGEPIVQMIDYLYAREPSMIERLGYLEQFWMLWHISKDRLDRGYSDGADIPITKGVYGVHNIDRYGDQLHTDSSYQTEAMREELDNHKAESYGEEFRSDSLGWNYLEEFVEWCRDRGVSIYFLPSTLMDNPHYHNDPKKREFYTNLPQIIRDRGWSYIGEPYNYMYDKSLYFNTNFHLNSRGREIRTKQMIEDILVFSGENTLPQ